MSPARSSHPTIPSFYRTFFTTIDPILCLWGAYMDFFTPRTVLSSHILSDTPDIGHKMILMQRGGLLLNLGFLSAVLLRYTQDLKVWHLVEMGLLLGDFAYFAAAYGALKSQDRLWPELWRAEDWGAFGVTAVVTLVRLAFLARVGFRGEIVGEEKKEK